MTNYKMRIYVSNVDDGCTPIGTCLVGNDVYELKLSIMTTVKTVCAVNNLHEDVFINANIENANGTWCDTEEFTFDASSGEIIY